VTPLAGRWLDLGVAALAASQLAAAAVLAPRGDAIALPGGAALGVTCPSRALFGVPCPFCGMTRSFVALAHGRPGAAIEHHPAGPFLMLAMFAFTVAAVVVAARGRTPLFDRRRVVRSVELVALAGVAIGVAHLMTTTRS
jgi:hypothetical protein